MTRLISKEYNKKAARTVIQWIAVLSFPKRESNKKVFTIDKDRMNKGEKHGKEKRCIKTKVIQDH